jgi:hypothetical protein
MDPGLVADLDRADAAREHGGGPAQHRVLGLPGRVGVVEADQVVVADAMPARPFGQGVPDCLIEAVGDEAPWLNVKVRFLHAAAIHTFKLVGF